MAWEKVVIYNVKDERVDINWSLKDKQIQKVCYVYALDFKP